MNQADLRRRGRFQRVTGGPKLTMSLMALSVLVPAAGLADSSRAGDDSAVFYIQPLGQDLPDADVALVAQALETFYDVKVKRLPRVDLPPFAYYPPRRRYRAEKLLSYLQLRLPRNGRRILGLTGVDISTTKGKYRDWGILGLATIDGSACVISAFRARKGAKNRQHARVRLAKTAVHEIGHTLGLEHCPTRGCLMEDARGKVATTDREYDICPRCRARLKARGRALPDHPTIPWPNPKTTR